MSTMATACELFEDQFHCSICHHVFAEPVTLPCGHNFCKKCIDQHWPISRKCQCPYCMKMFFYRPELKINLFIAKMASQFIMSQYKSRRRSESQSQAPKPAEVLCDVCMSPKQLAHKSCLVCHSLYCEFHLKLHLNMCGLKKHQLMEPVREIKKHVSAEHVHLFCRNGQLCVCVGHEIVPLKEASEPRRVLLLKTEVDIQDKISRRIKKIDELSSSVKVSNDAADREISDGVKVFTALKEAVERGLDLFISEITRKKKDTEQQAQSLIQEIELEVGELERRGAEVKQLSESHDLLHLLNSPELSPEPPTKEWTDVNICPQTYEGTVLRALSELQQDFSEKARSLCEAMLKRVKTMEVNFTLNGNKTSYQLNQTVEHGKIPDSPDRCDGVFFSEKKVSESFYSKAEVRGKDK